MIVELKCASIPFPWFFAMHYWFVTWDCRKRERWEVWHVANAGGISSGYLHRNLMHPDLPVGGGISRTEHAWEGALAERLWDILARSAGAYPYRETYRSFPGPNSNTFVAWVLKEAEIRYDLSWRAVGKDFADIKDR